MEIRVSWNLEKKNGNLTEFKFDKIEILIIDNSLRYK